MPMDVNFTLYFDFLKETNGAVDDASTFEIPKMEDVLQKIDEEGIEYAPSDRLVQGIMGYAYQYDVAETRQNIWDLNLN